MISTKGTKEEIEYRREKLREIIRENIIDSHELARSFLSDTHGIGASIPTIHRDFKALGIQLTTDENGIRKYILTDEETRKFHLSQLKGMLNYHSARKFKKNLNFLAISVKTGYADIIGTRITELYPDSFMGYLTSSNLLLLISDSDSKIEESFYTEMRERNFIDEE